mmetsp:Transcript_33132/g.74976  ORF Transcript_33132/g.74976 Transcript_33132/m.74976 type:complete len:208 (+) Transcript_33132:347-970(+)
MTLHGRFCVKFDCLRILLLNSFFPEVQYAMPRLKSELIQPSSSAIVLATHKDYIESERHTKSESLGLLPPLLLASVPLLGLFVLEAATGRLADWRIVETQLGQQLGRGLLGSCLGLLRHDRPRFPSIQSRDKGLAILIRVKVVPDRAAVLELDVVPAVLRRAIPALQVVRTEDQHFLALCFERHIVLITAGQVFIRDTRLAVELRLH